MKINRINLALSLYLIALLSMAIAGYYFYGDFTQGRDQKHAAQSERFQTDLTYVDLPRILVNLPSDSSSRIGNVRLDLTLEVENKYAARLEGFRPRIVDRLIDYARKLDYDELARPSATLWLRQDMLKEANLASGPVPIKDIIFRRFVVL